MKWTLTAKKLVIVSLLSGAAAVVAYFAAHLGELDVPFWAMPVAQAVLTGLAAAIANAIKHWKDVPA